MYKRQALERALALRPDDSRTLFWLAKLALHREVDSQKARELLERALTANPRCAECLSLLISVLCEEDHELDRCGRLATDLVAVASDWPRAHEIAAEIAERAGQVEDARQEYLQALRLAEQFQSKDLPWSYFEEVVTGRHPTVEAIGRVKAALKRLPNSARPE